MLLPCSFDLLLIADAWRRDTKTRRVAARMSVCVCSRASLFLFVSVLYGINTYKQTHRTHVNQVQMFTMSGPVTVFLAFFFRAAVSLPLCLAFAVA